MEISQQANMVNSLMINREAQLKQNLIKQAVLANALNDPRGLKKIAAALTNPVRRKLDYVGICRKFVVTELWPEGMPIVFDRDVEEFTAVVVGKNGTARYVEIEVERVELKEFEIMVNPRVPYKELYARLFNVVTRVKERLEQSLALREDTIFYAALDDAALLYHPVFSSASYLTKDGLSRTFTPLESERISPQNVIMTAFGTQSMRRWQFQDLDDVARAEVRSAGYLGSIWGAQFYVTDQLPGGTYYVTGGPEILGWMPFRKEAEVIPADIPQDLVLGMVGYENYAFTIHNVRAVVKGTFNTNA